MRWFTDAQVTEIARKVVAIQRQRRGGSLSNKEYGRQMSSLEEAVRKMPAADRAALNKRVAAIAQGRF